MPNDIILDGERIDEVNERIRLIQKKDGLTFGTDAFLLAAYMKPQRSAVAAELGCGTGIISLLCAARERFSQIHAFEIQPEFAELTNRNISINSLDSRVVCKCRDVRGHVFKKRGDDGAFLAASDELTRGAVAHDEPHRVDDDGFTCARFTGKYGKTAARGDGFLLDDGNVLDIEFF